MTRLDSPQLASGVTGDVLETNEGPAVVCGDAAILLVARVRVGDRTLEGPEVASVLRPGDRLA